MSNVIEFPNKEPTDSEEEYPENDLANGIMTELIQTLVLAGYDVRDEVMIKDLGIVYASLVATLARANGNHHALISILDAIHNNIETEGDQ